MDVNVDKKAEETVVKLLDWVQNQIVDGVLLLDGAHPLPDVLEATAKLIGVMNASKLMSSPEVISPLSKLSKILGGERKYYGAAVDSPSPRLDERIREIAREEVAAHEERLVDLVKESLHVEATDFLAGTDGILRGTSE